MTDFSLLLPRGQLRDAALQAEDDDAPARRPQGDRAGRRTRSCSSTCSTRPGDANIKSLSVTLPSAFEIDQRHLGNICSEKELAAKQCAGPHADRQGDDDDAAARPAARAARSTRSPAPAACRDWPSSSTARSTWCPRAEHDHGQRRPPADDRPGRPRRADRPLPPDRLRRQDRLPGQHPRHLRQHPGHPGRLHRPEREYLPSAGQASGGLRW